MAHDHSHGGLDHAPKEFSRAFLIGIGLNLSFVIVETVYGVLSHSGARKTGVAGAKTGVTTTNA